MDAPAVKAEWGPPGICPVEIGCYVVYSKDRGTVFVNVRQIEPGDVSRKHLVYTRIGRDFDGWPEGEWTSGDAIDGGWMFAGPLAHIGIKWDHLGDGVMGPDAYSHAFPGFPE